MEEDKFKDINDEQRRDLEETIKTLEERGLNVLLVKSNSHVNSIPDIYLLVTAEGDKDANLGKLERAMNNLAFKGGSATLVDDPHPYMQTVIDRRYIADLNGTLFEITYSHEPHKILEVLPNIEALERGESQYEDGYVFYLDESGEVELLDVDETKD